MGRFTTNVSWNLVSFAIQGAAGILLNILIGRFAGAEALGVFNQVLALLILFSQLGAFGIHYSILTQVAKHSHELTFSPPPLVASGLFCAFIASSLVTLFCYATLPLLESLGLRAGILEGWRLALPGLWAFCLNKALLAVLNGRGQMRWFAFYSSLRYVLWLGVLIFLLWRNSPSTDFSLLLSWGELLLLITLLPVALGGTRLLPTPGWGMRALGHFKFGSLSMLSGALIELNTRVDVLLLGYFSTDRAVGIYSAASMLVEGLYQITVAVRNTLNPEISRTFFRGLYDELKSHIQAAKRLSFSVLLVVGVISIAVYPLFARYALGGGDFLESYPLFSIMVGFLVLFSRYCPLTMFFLQIERPLLQTGYQGAVTATTLALNAALIPPLGALGAAIGTGLSFGCAAWYLRCLVRGRVGLHI